MEDKLQTREQMLADCVPANDGWIEHDGGPCPVADDVRVDVKFRDGDIQRDHAASAWRSWWPSIGDGNMNDIIAYRVVQP